MLSLKQTTTRKINNKGALGQYLLIFLMFRFEIVSYYLAVAGLELVI